MIYDDPEELKAYCKECNGYLFSMSVHDVALDDPRVKNGAILMACPMVKAPGGGCTGEFRSTTETRRQAPLEDFLS